MNDSLRSLLFYSINVYCKTVCNKAISSFKLFLYGIKYSHVYIDFIILLL